MSKVGLNEDIVLYGSHDALRNYIYVDDLSEVITEMFGKVSTYACMNTQNIRFSEIARAAIGGVQEHQQNTL